MRVEEQSNQGSSIETQCRYCGNEQNPVRSPDERAAHYQVVVACAQCGNDFAAISRN